MKTLEPSYYENFECIGDRCKDNCCTGWRVIIDKSSYEKYEQMKDEFGDRLNSNLRKVQNSENDEEFAEFILDNNMKCPLLNENKLCDLYINKGADHLCHICTSYPRIVTLYGEIAERNLSLSCPSVAQLLVDKNQKIDFIMNDEIKYNKNETILMVNKQYDELYNLVWEGRNLSIDLAQFTEIPIWKRLIIIKLISDRIQSRINSGEIGNEYIFIDELKNELISESLLKALDDIEKPNKILKINLVLMIFEFGKNHGMGNKKLTAIVENIKILLDKSEDIEKTLNHKEEQFDKYFKMREYILENYIVYNLYNLYMKSLINKNLDIEIFELIISYSIVKLSLLAIWDKNNEKLTDDEIVDVLYSLSREMEHSDTFIQSLYDDMSKKGVNTMGHLITMIY